MRDVSYREIKTNQLIQINIESYVFITSHRVYFYKDHIPYTNEENRNVVLFCNTNIKKVSTHTHTHKKKKLHFC